MTYRAWAGVMPAVAAHTQSWLVAGTFPVWLSEMTSHSCATSSPGSRISASVPGCSAERTPGRQSRVVAGLSCGSSSALLVSGAQRTARHAITRMAASSHGHQRCNTVTGMDVPSGVQAYRPAALTDLAGWLAGATEEGRWRLVVEFLEEYRHEQAADRWELLADEPRRSVMSTGTGCSRR